MPRDPSNPGPNPPQSWTEEDLRAATGEDMKRQADEHGGDPPELVIGKKVRLSDGCFLLMQMLIAAPFVVAIGARHFHAEDVRDSHRSVDREDLEGRLEEFQLAAKHDASGNMAAHATALQARIAADYLPNDDAAIERLKRLLPRKVQQDEAVRYYLELRRHRCIQDAYDISLDEYEDWHPEYKAH